MDKGKKKQRSKRGRGRRAADGRSGQQASQTAIWVRDFQGPQRTKKTPPTYLSRDTERERDRERERKNLIQLVEGGEGGGGVHRLGLAEHLLQHDADAAATTNYSSKEKG
jgi:hypothetical protein